MPGYPMGLSAYRAAAATYESRRSAGEDEDDARRRESIRAQRDALARDEDPVDAFEPPPGRRSPGSLPRCLWEGQCCPLDAECSGCADYVQETQEAR